MLTGLSTVREAALLSPESARLLEKSGIDYCCEGNLSLAAACAQAEIGLGRLLWRLEHCSSTGPASSVDWMEAPLARLGRYVTSRHHRLEQQLCARIQRQLSLITVSAGPHYLSYRQLTVEFAGFAALLREHLEHEEETGFAAIARWESAVTQSLSVWERARAASELRLQLLALMREHEQISAEIRTLERNSGAFPASDNMEPEALVLHALLQELLQDLRWHMHLENNVLYQRVLQSLPDEALAASA
ncbi:MAG: hypothetical protein EPN33_11055 [Acidobacteria bacterium]|nr:MAG: hypothetical protein EPN33_11055 [Acidobacteriota bacterium]